MSPEDMELFINEVAFDWSRLDEDSYVFGIDALRGLEKIELRSPVTFLVGENGSGKATLLEAIAVEYGFSPEGGTPNYSFSTYEESPELADAIRLIRGTRRAKWGYFLRAESFFNVATKEEEYSKNDPRAMPAYYHYQSHGESFLALAQNNFKGGGFYLLDEPEAALSPQRQLSLLIEIYRCAKDGAQFIIATHSPILLGLPDAEILSFDDGQMHPVAYEETDSYKITEMFLHDRERLLWNLLSQE